MFLHIILVITLILYVFAYNIILYYYSLCSISYTVAKKFFIYIFFVYKVHCNTTSTYTLCFFSEFTSRYRLEFRLNTSSFSYSFLFLIRYYSYYYSLYFTLNKLPVVRHAVIYSIYSFTSNVILKLTPNNSILTSPFFNLLCLTYYILQ